MNFVTPSGFRDVLPSEAQRRERVIRDVQQCFADQGYEPIETPTLEVMGVMRAGGRVPGSPFKFFDARGDLLAMRPDVTLQIARMCGTRFSGEERPLRFRYTQRVFREAESQLQAAARELTQIGVECVGPQSAQADAEVVELLARALEVSGVAQFRLSLATVGVLRALLSRSGAPEAWRAQVLEAYHASNYVALDELCDVANPQMASLAAGTAPAYAAAIRALPRIRGGREAIEKVRELVAPLGCVDGLDGFQETFELLAARGLGERLLVDFSVMSSFDYYTGIVFEAYAPGLGTPLGSGGRYDNMVGAYGAPRPAAGFAFYLEQAMAAAGEEGGESGDATGAAGVAAVGAAEVAAAVNSPQATSPERPLRIAVPKGSLNADTIAALAAAGLDVAGLGDPGRQLIIRRPGVDYVIVRPTDAPTFVALGAADCGICGKDSLLEANSDVVELVDLGFGACRFVVAEPEGAAAATEGHFRTLGSIRVATKYPNITRAFYAQRGMQVEIVKLHGNIELAPLTGMAERIVDITATGTTLRENNLVVVDEVLASTARFFANTCAFRTDERVVKLARALQQVAQGGEDGGLRTQGECAQRACGTQQADQAGQEKQANQAKQAKE